MLLLFVTYVIETAALGPAQDTQCGTERRVAETLPVLEEGRIKRLLSALGLRTTGVSDQTPSRMSTGVRPPNLRSTQRQRHNTASDTQEATRFTAPAVSRTA